MMNDDLQFELRGLRALIDKQDKEIEALWKKRDVESDIKMALLHYVRKSESVPAIVEILRDAKVSEAAQYDTVQYLMENFD